MHMTKSTHQVTVPLSNGFGACNLFIALQMVMSSDNDGNFTMEEFTYLPAA